MEVITLQSEVFKALMDKLNSIESQLEKISNRKPRLEDEYIDSTEVCQLLNISRKTLERYRDMNNIPHTKIKKRVYYRFSDIDKFMYLNSTKATPGTL